MALKRMVMELGMGTDIRGEDYTKAACRGLHNALRQNSLTVADAFGVSRDGMQVEIIVGVQQPDEIQTAEVAAMLPYGTPSVRVEKGGMDTQKEGGGAIIMANVAVIVYLDLLQSTLEGVQS